MENQLKEINLRLKQLVALEMLEAIYEGRNPNCYGIDDDYNYEDEDSFHEAMEREHATNNIDRKHYVDDFIDATDELIKLKKEGIK